MAWLQRLHAHQLIKIPPEQQLRFLRKGQERHPPNENWNPRLIFKNKNYKVPLLDLTPHFLTFYIINFAK